MNKLKLSLQNIQDILIQGYTEIIIDEKNRIVVTLQDIGVKNTAMTIQKFNTDE